MDPWLLTQTYHFDDDGVIWKQEIGGNVEVLEEIRAMVEEAEEAAAEKKVREPIRRARKIGKVRVVSSACSRCV